MGKKGAPGRREEKLEANLELPQRSLIQENDPKRVNRRRKIIKEPALRSAFCPCGSASFGALL